MIIFLDKVPSQKVPFETQKLNDLRHLMSERVAYEPCYLGDIMYCGRLIPARHSSACFLMFNSTCPRFHEVPQSLRVGILILFTG